MRRFVVAMVLAVGGAAWCAGQERLLNRDFAEGIAGWTEVGTSGSVAWEPAFGRGGPGALRVASGPGYQVRFYAGQCVSGVVPGALYVLAGQVWLGAGEADAFATLGYQSFTTQGCSGPPAAMRFLAHVPYRDVWNQVDEGYILEPGVVSIRVLFGIQHVASQPATVFWDDVSATGPVPAGPAAVPLGGGGLALLALALAAAGWLALRSLAA